MKTFRKGRKNRNFRESRKTFISTYFARQSYEWLISFANELAKEINFFILSAYICV